MLPGRPRRRGPGPLNVVSLERSGAARPLLRTRRSGPAVLRLRRLLTAGMLVLGCALVLPAQAGIEVNAQLEVPDGDGGTRRVTIDYLDPPGRMIDLGTHRLHIFCMGEQRPTVVLEAGLGGLSLEWLKVQRDLSHDFRTCVYDRAGYGWSDPGPLPRTAAHLAGELRQLLLRADERPPYVLVGHSFGGYVVQYFARAFPRNVAGLVLVDSSHPAQASRLPQAHDEAAPATAGGRRQFVSWAIMHEHFPAEVKTLAYYFMQSRRATRTRRTEWLTLALSGDQIQELNPLPNVPTVVLTRGERVWPHTRRGDAMEAAWRVLQADLAASSPAAVQVVVPFSGHHIHLDQPWAVEEAIRSVVRGGECGTAQVATHDALPAADRAEC